MKILLLGGAGGMSHAIIKDFLTYESDDLKSLVVTDIKEDKAKVVAQKSGSPKVSAMGLDSADLDQLVKAMKDMDVVINTAPGTGPTVLKAALETHTHMVDIGGSGEVVKESMKLSPEFEKIDRSAIFGLGSSPGIMNLIAKAVTDDLDTVDEVFLSFAYASLGTSTMPYKVPFYGALQEFVRNPSIYEDGKLTQIPPLSGLEDLRYPEPIGVRRSFFIPHPEVTTLPMALAQKGLRRLGIKAGFTPDFYEKTAFLASIGLIACEPMKVKGQDVVPMDLMQACVENLPPDEGDIKDYGVSRVVATGLKDGKKLKITAVMMSYPFQGLTSAQHRTGHAPAIGARLLCQGVIKKRGVFPPELGVDTGPFFKELARRELEVEKSQVSYL